MTPGSPRQRLDRKVEEYRYFRKLPDDVCRCHDDACPERETCLRFLQREIGGIRVVHSATLRQKDEPCQSKIPSE